MKKLLIGLLALASFSTFAADVCVVFPTVQNKLTTSIRCSHVNEGKIIERAEDVTVSLSKALGEGFEIQSTNVMRITDGVSPIIYTLVRK